MLDLAGTPAVRQETLYIAVTRAGRHVQVIGSAETRVAAAGRPAARATGLRERLLLTGGGRNALSTRHGLA